MVSEETPAISTTVLDDCNVQNPLSSFDTGEVHVFFSCMLRKRSV